VTVGWAKTVSPVPRQPPKASRFGPEADLEANIRAPRLSKSRNSPSFPIC